MAPPETVWASDLIAAELGAGWKDKASLQDAMERDESLLLVATIDSIPVGLAIAAIGKDGRGTLETVAVSSTSQSRGIGTRLVEHACKALVDQGAVRISVPAWRRRSGIPIAGLLARLGFIAEPPDEEAYRAGCQVKAFKCPDRNLGPCVCACVVFTRSF